MKTQKPVAEVIKTSTTFQCNVSDPNNFPLGITKLFAALTKENNMSKAQWIKENLKTGELYAGLILGENGQPDHHLVLLPGEAESVSWAKAKEFAKKAGGELPTRREQSLLFANLKVHFQPRWYWSSEEHASDSSYAWGQYFYSGFQLSNRKSYEYRARAIRRIFL